MNPLVIFPSSKLLDVSRQVYQTEIEQGYLKQLVESMFKVMYASNGVGLAAIQVGVPLRVFVMDKSGKDKKNPQVFVNPVITEFVDDAVLTEEGCLSFPGIRVNVPRHLEVVMTADTVGGPQTFQLEGLEAHIAQHEIEHLDGITMAAKWTLTEKDIVKRKIRKVLKRR